MWSALPTSDYYGSSAPTRRHGWTMHHPARQHEAGGLRERGVGSHVHRETVRQVRCPALPQQHRHGYAAGLPRSLPTGDFDRSKSSPRRKVVGARCNPAQIRQVRAGGSILRGVRSLVPHVHLPVSLAGPTPSGSAGASRRCRGCFRPASPSPLVRLPPASTVRCDERQAVSSHHRTVSWRLMALEAAHPGAGAGQGLPAAA
jgi:hypothetical protein